MPELFQNNVSVVIVNYDRLETTIKCIESLERSTDGYVREILIVDNGSSPEVLSALTAAVDRRARLVPLGTNRYFGEGNNIGVEEATGDFILLLNNDAYVEPTCISHLVRSMREDPAIAAVGPMFLYPNGTVQEVGGIALATGDIVQIGKGAIWDPDHYTQECAVDYCSAACLLMRKKDFLRAEGFSYRWEPAYYEDVDLCLTLWNQAGPVVVNPQAQVVHLESLTTSDARMRLESQVEINRLAFVEKWGEWLKARHTFLPSETRISVAPGESEIVTERPSPSTSHRASGRPGVKSAVLYTPYELIPGGGERVLFELGSVLVDSIGETNVHVATPHRYSDLRIQQLRDVFGVSGPSKSSTIDEFRANPPDVHIVLGNEIVPPIPGYGRLRNIYLCQFPFDAPPEYIQRHAESVATFDEIWVYSNFVRRYVNGHLRLLGLRSPTIRVIYPPATVPRPERLPDWHNRASIMTVGRFFKGGHNKRQDLVIDIVRLLAERFDRSVPLVIAGALHASAGSRERFRELQAMTEGIECYFYPNVSRERLIDLYANAAVLVHAAGHGIDKYSSPERLEHFGIVPIEAASMGCIPVVYGEGGPAEVMDILECPTTFHTIDEAVEIVNGLFDDQVGSEQMSRDLIRKSKLFSRQAFRDRVYEALEGLL